MLLTPREWYARYGQAVVREVSMTVTFQPAAQPDLDRYLLWFMVNVPGVELRPRVGSLAASSFTDLAEQGGLYITHALHGSMVNLGWEVRSGAGAPTLLVIEAFMRPTVVEQCDLVRGIDPQVLEAELARLANGRAFTGGQNGAERGGIRLQSDNYQFASVAGSEGPAPNPFFGTPGGSG